VATDEGFTIISLPMDEVRVKNKIKGELWK
jgi:hypothetical protein